MSSVGEDFPKQQKRVRGILKMYYDIGPAGSFGALIIEQTLTDAEEAISGGDIIEILKSYEALREVQE